VVATESNNKFKYAFLLSLITIACAMIIFILILVNQFGSFNILSRHDNPFVKPKIALLLSDYNFDFFRENKGNYQGIIDQWYNMIKEFDVKPVLLRDADLENGKELDSDILIIPSAVCLSEKQIAKIKAYVKNGGGLITSWAAGARRKGGSWRDWSFLEDIADLKIIKMDEKNPISMSFMTVNSDSPVTQGIPSGLRIDLDSDSSEILARSDRVDSFYSDWRLYPVISEKGYPPYTAMTHNHYGKGKVLWLGFNSNRLLTTKENRFFFKKLVSNAFSWMQNYPQGTIDNWAYGYKAAFLIDQDTEDQHKNTDNLVRIMVEEGFPGTFFCLSEIFEKDPNYLRRLIPKTIEIGSHLDTAQTLKDQDYNTQHRRIKKSVLSLKKLTGRDVIGLKPAEEIFDSNTIKVLMNLGFKYMIGNPKTSVAVPVIVTKDSIPKDVVRLEHLVFPPEGDFVLFPRIAHDDYKIMDDFKILDNSKILSILQADFHNIYNLGGIYIFAVHTQMFSTPPHMKVIQDMLRYVKNYDIWSLKGKDFAWWWVGRSKLENSVTSFDDDKFVITLKSKNSSKTMKNVGLTYYLGQEPEEVNVTDLTSGEKLEHKYDSGSRKLQIKVAMVKPQSRQKIEVSLKKPKEK